MLAVGVWLFVLGACDLLRAARDITTPRRRLLIIAIGVTLLVFLGVASGLEGTEWVGLGLGWVGTFLVWMLASSVALERGTGIARGLAFAGLFGGIALTVLGGGVLDQSRELPSWLGGSLLDQLPPDYLVLLLGVSVFQLSSANVLVRLVLDAAGVPATTNEKKLKGGRLLGPMERLFILGLGLAGELTAAAIVVAAKGLLRFPELQRGDDSGGPSDVTEYFLIGSMASWLVALGGLGLAWVGAVQ